MKTGILRLYSENFWKIEILMLVTDDSCKKCFPEKDLFIHKSMYVAKNSSYLYKSNILV